MPSSFASSHSCAPVLASMNDHGLSFRGGIELIGYSDADWAGDADTRWSISAYFLLLDSGLIYGKSKKQNLISTSPTKAE